MKKSILVCVLLLAAAWAVFAQGPKNVDEKLDGYQEDALVISTAGRGDFHGRISNDGNSFAWELSYSNLESPITQAHIHLGGHSQNGGIIAFLCTNLDNAPDGVDVQECPDQPATIDGVLDEDDIVGPAGQGIAAMEFDEFLRALRADSTYVNVHTEVYPAGEIRANIGGPGKGKGKGKGHH